MTASARAPAAAVLVGDGVFAEETQPLKRKGRVGCAVHLVAGSTTSPVLTQIARKRSLNTGSCAHAESVCSYSAGDTRCGVLATKRGRDEELYDVQSSPYKCHLIH